MSYCSKCGVQNNDDAVFCNSCGAQIEKPQPVLQQPPVSSEQEPVADYQPQQQQPQGQAYTDMYQYPQQPSPYTAPYPTPVRKKTRSIIALSVAIVAVAFLVFAGILTYVIVENKLKSDATEPAIEIIVTAPPETLPSATPEPTPDVITEIIASRTIMIYLVGSDLETYIGAASMDIMEMLESGVDLDENNVIIMTGGAMQWQNDTISADKIEIYELGEDEIIKVWDSPNQSMASPETLEGFLIYCYDNYPADAYDLIMWNHGAGPMFGFGYDENYGEILSIPMLASALEQSPFGAGNKLDIIGFDACLMGTIEIAFALSDYGTYLVASQEVIPGWGWDYSYLGDITPDDTGEDVAIKIIDTYYDFCESIFEYRPDFTSDISLSCLSLDNVALLESELNGLYSKVDANLDETNFPETALVRYRVKEFGYTNMEFSYDLVDISHLSRLMASAYPAEAADLASAIDSLVCYNRTNIPNAGGVSLYFPYKNNEMIDELADFYQSYSFADDYTTFIYRFVELLQDAPEIDWNMADVPVTQESASQYSIQLTPEQIETYASANYYIVMDYNDDSETGNFAGFYFVFNSSDVTLEDDGRLVAHYEGKTQMMYDPEDDSTFGVTMLQSELTETYVRYLVPIILRDWTSSDWNEWKSKNAWIHIQMDLDGSNVRVLSVLPSIDDVDNDNAFLPSREWVDIYEYALMECWSWAREVKYNDDGSLAPFPEWESGGKGVGWEVHLNPVEKNNLTFVQQERDDEHDYYMLINVKDVYGNVVSSDMIKIEN